MEQSLYVDPELLLYSPYKNAPAEQVKKVPAIYQSIIESKEPDVNPGLYRSVSDIQEVTKYQYDYNDEHNYLGYNNNSVDWGSSETGQDALMEDVDASAYQYATQITLPNFQKQVNSYNKFHLNQVLLWNFCNQYFIRYQVHKGHV